MFKQPLTTQPAVSHGAVLIQVISTNKSSGNKTMIQPSLLNLHKPGIMLWQIPLAFFACKLSCTIACQHPACSLNWIGLSKRQQDYSSPRYLTINVANLQSLFYYHPQAKKHARWHNTPKHIDSIKEQTNCNKNKYKGKNGHTSVQNGCNDKFES